MRPGSASGLRATPCMAAPARPSAPPASRPRTVRGMRACTTAWSPLAGSKAARACHTVSKGRPRAPMAREAPANRASTTTAASSQAVRFPLEAPPRNRARAPVPGTEVPGIRAWWAAVVVLCVTEPLLLRCVRCRGQLGQERVQRPGQAQRGGRRDCQDEALVRVRNEGALLDGRDLAEQGIVLDGVRIAGFLDGA